MRIIYTSGHSLGVSMYSRPFPSHQGDKVHYEELCWPEYY